LEFAQKHRAKSNNWFREILHIPKRDIIDVGAESGSGDSGNLEEDLETIYG
jgi:hypothetical protein